ncbi:MAG: hypothetical protein ACSHXK_15940 [Oceanococcus sp.]
MAAFHPFSSLPHILELIVLSRIPVEGPSLGCDFGAKSLVRVSVLVFDAAAPSISARECSDAAYIGAKFLTVMNETAFFEIDANYLHGDTAHGFDGWLTVGMTF